ncbi:outer membrane protein [Thioflavicoccus mobilis 8321]|uniref:Outer membrane protein n=1 Tax=Thioflavicoccus mobilis 8321 TaxID=765912 RepID=L0H272_9GAMM|nr:TolC family protein [Thioflavicoccus mobilis]AGA92142.1 outer membrane protein [Thioflavicoccus mobilis 8321]
MRISTDALHPLHLAALLATLWLTACGGLPERTDYAAAAKADVAGVSAWSALDVGTPSAHLDELIRSPELDALVAEALTANPDLQQTLLTLEILRAEQRRTGAARLPSLEAGLAGDKGEDAGTSYTGSLTLGWELDLWRKLSDEYRAAGLDVAEQQALYESARDTLAAEVMQTWLGLIADWHAVAIERRRLATLAKNEQFIIQRYRNGLGTLEDLASARTSTASSRANLESYEESLAQHERQLRGLLGRTDAAPIATLADYPEVGLPLAEMPAQTLARRPDLRAAYLAIEAADLRTSVAYKDLLPRIDLQAALTDVARSPGEALLSDPVWSLLAQLTAPLYQGGRLRAAVEVAKLKTAQAYQAYRETLVDAVTQVGDALGQERSLAKQQTHITTALAAARNNLAQYQRSYRTGLVDILDLLSVQQSTYDLEAQLDELRFQRLDNRIALGLALGLGVSE